MVCYVPIMSPRETKAQKVTHPPIAQSNAGQAVSYFLAVGTATAAPKLSVVEGAVAGIGSKIVPPVAAVTSAKDILAHLNCAVKSILPGPTNMDLLDLVL